MTAAPHDVITNRSGHTRLIGYARVSRPDQQLDAQIERLKKAGCSRIYAERVSSVAPRTGFAALRAHVRRGDIVVVTRLDRLGRRLAELVLCAEELGNQGVHVRALAQGINTSQPGGKLAFAIFAALAQTERELLIERTNEGLAAAVARGVRLGRKATFADPLQREQAKHLRSCGYSDRQIGARLGVSRWTVWRALEGVPRPPDARTSTLPPPDPRQLVIGSYDP